MQASSCELTADLRNANSDSIEPCLNVLIPETYYHKGSRLQQSIVERKPLQKVLVGTQLTLPEKYFDSQPYCLVFIIKI